MTQIPKVVINESQMRFLQLFRDLSGIVPKDVVEEEGKLVFVVEEGDMARVLGRRGENLRLMRQILERDLGRSLDVVEFSGDPGKFIANILRPARVLDVKIREVKRGKVAHVVVRGEDMSIAIGRGGRRINRARKLVKRWFGIGNVKISGR